MSEKVFERMRLVFMGQREGANGRLRYLYQEVDAAGALVGEPRIFMARLLKRQGRAGGVLEASIIRNEEGSIHVVSEGLEYVGMYDDREQLVVWQAEHDAVKLSRAKVRDRQVNLVKEQLAPLKELYRRLSVPKRRALLALIIEHITSGRK